ncbi:hypothetical protein [Gordonia amicalis]|uniref:hypothetical protein n=1 Tax=Gordonia amicalis TaxID=89053 RepID=UPI0012692DC8|nr:hypothetical protein [Gordonia amicalis]
MADERARAAEALALRRSGMRYDEISARLGYRDESGPRKAVNRLLDRTEAEGVAELRAVEGERLDALLAAHWDAALRGDIDATKAVLAVIDRRAKLFGLNAPTAVAIGGAVITDREFAEQAVELIAALRPETVAEAVRSAPGIHAGAPSALPEGQSTRETVSSVSVAHSADSGDPEPWADAVDDVAAQRVNTAVVGVVSPGEPETVIDAETVIEADPTPAPVAEPEPDAHATTEVGQTTAAQRRYRMPAGQVYAPPVDGFRRRIGNGGRTVTVVHNAP